jgi:hypothetical protein
MACVDFIPFSLSGVYRSIVAIVGKTSVDVRDVLHPSRAQLSIFGAAQTSARAKMENVLRTFILHGLSSKTPRPS